MLMLAGMLTQTSFGQATTDTIPKRDSLLSELQDGMLDNTPVISLDENDMGGGGSQNVASMLTAGRDPFYAATGFNWSAVRFRMRGYDNDNFSTYMNGVPMDNLDNGFTPYGVWGGLNDVMRNRDVSYGLRFNTFNFGDIGSNTHIDARASKQRKQTSVKYAASNRTYRHLMMVTHGSGMNKNGWAYAGSVSRRYSNEGFVPGTYYDGWSYFGAVDKRINTRNLLSLVVFGAPTENSRQSAAVQEAFDLSGTNFYNPSWGYQNGKKRSANVGRTNQPTAILSHDMKLSANTSLLTGISYSTGKRSVTALDWYNAPDPRPDYYRYLPSYYNSLTRRDLVQFNQLTDKWKNDESIRQINWMRLYDANRNNIRSVTDANGIVGNIVTGKRANYVLEERITKTDKLNFNTTINSTVNENLDLTGGISYMSQKNRYYKEVNDLLGADFYVNRNQFAERDFPMNPLAAENDLDNPNRILHQGDKFGYDYNLVANRIGGWAQGVFLSLIHI